jgi:hypothetical protein
MASSANYVVSALGMPVAVAAGFDAVTLGVGGLVLVCNLPALMGELGGLF